MTTTMEASISAVMQKNLETYFKLTASEFNANNKIHYILSQVPYPFLNIITQTYDTLEINNNFVSSIVDYYRNNGVNSFCWFLEETSYSKRISELLLANNFTNVGSFSGLALDLSSYQPANPSLPTDYTFSEVKTREQLRNWSVPFQVAFSYSAAAINKLLEYYDNLISSNNFKHVVIYKKNEPVGCGSLLIDDNIAGLYNLAVLPEHQNQGIGLALQQIRLNLAVKSGCKMAVMQAASISEHIGKKLGFAKVTTYLPYLYTNNEAS